MREVEQSSCVRIAKCDDSIGMPGDELCRRRGQPLSRAAAETTLYRKVLPFYPAEPAQRVLKKMTWQRVAVRQPAQASVGRRFLR